jgi:oxygen-dependent protoporphyrinogen oxidase
MKRIVIVGGGISGLALAHVLLERDETLDVTVLESEARAGGKIWSDRADGFLCEKGPNGFLDNKPPTLRLCSSLGIEPLRSNDNSRRRFIYSGGKLNALPESPPAFIKSDILSWNAKFRLLFEFNAPKGPPDETVADFILRRLGREVLEKLIDPMCSGIYAGDPYRMSIRHCFPRIKELEQEYGSLIRALINLRRQKKHAGGSSEANVSAAPGGTLTSFREGIQVFTDALAGRLGDRLKTGATVNGISRDNDIFKVDSSAGVFEADVAVIAVPAHAAAEMTRDLDREISEAVAGIPYPHVAVVCLGYRKEKVGHALDGFGFLVPGIERRKILGTLWDSSIFPDRAPEGHALLRTMLGGARYPEMADMEDGKIGDLVLQELRQILGLKSDPEFVRIYRWQKAIPQYTLGHGRILERLANAVARHPGLHITGNAYRGIGINDCVENAYRLAEEITRSKTG